MLLAGAIACHSPEASVDRPAAVDALKERWFGDLKPAVDGRGIGEVPTLNSLRNSSWAGADSVLLVASIGRVSGGALPPALGEATQLELAVAWARQTAPEHPLAAFLADDPGDDVTGAWRAWLTLQDVEREPPPVRLPAAEALLQAWPGHPVACTLGARSALQLRDYVRAEVILAQCDVQASAVAAAHADWLDAVGAWRQAAETYERVGRGDHALRIRCIEDADPVRPAGIQPDGPPPFGPGWCVAAGALSLEAVPGLDLALARRVPPELQADWDLLKAAVALRSDRPDRMDPILDGRSDRGARLLKARTRRAGGAVDSAAFAQLHAEDPTNVHVLRSWSHTDPEAASRALLGGDPFVTVLQATHRDRSMPMVGLNDGDWARLDAHARAVADVFDALHRAARPIPAGDSEWHALARLVRDPGSCGSDLAAVDVLCGPPGQGTAAPHRSVPLSELAAAWSIPDQRARTDALAAWADRYSHLRPEAFLWRLHRDGMPRPESVDARLPRR